jgi:Zn ribbon nucleic-acid-binding protein
MATGRKRIRANPVVVCPRCRGYLELQLQGEEYQHLQCISCKTQVMIPLKVVEGGK